MTIIAEWVELIVLYFMKKDITAVTRLPARTVRYALNRLKIEDILEEREYFQVAGFVAGMLLQ